MKMRSFVKCSLLVAVLVLALLAINLESGRARSPFIVNSILDGVDVRPGDGVCTDGAGKCTLRTAIMEANALTGADTIQLAAGTYILTIAGTDEDKATTGDLDITDSLSLNGASQSSTIVDGGYLDRVFEILGSSTEVEIFNITIRNGFFDNGGGIELFDGGTLILNNSTLSRNSSGKFGGGIFNQNGTVTLINSTISDGGAEADGGGIFNQRGQVSIIGSTVSGNTGRGGIFTENGKVTLTNSTISDGIFNVRGQVTLASSTISGGINNNDLGLVKLINTIVADDSPYADCLGEQIVSNGHNLDSDGTCVTNSVNGDITSPSPRLGPLQINPPGSTKTVALLFGSPAINAGDSSACPATDQRGVSRPQGGRCDIGAFEVAEADLSSLTIIKEAPAASQNQFVFGGNLGNFDLVPGEAQTFTRVPPGTYSVQEDSQSFPQEGYWVLNSVRCQVEGGNWFYPEIYYNDDTLAPIDIPVEASQHLTCIFLNKPGLSSLTIIKEAPAADPKHQFAFFDSLGDFKLAHGESRTFNDLRPGSYSVVEDGRSFSKGERLISVRCHIAGGGWFYPEIFDGGDEFYFTGVLIPVQADQQISCTFLNEPANLEEDTGTQIYLPLILK